MILEFVKAYPWLFIMLVSFVISLIMTWLYKVMTNQEKMKEMKEKQKEFNLKAKELKNQPEKLIELQKEMMAHSADAMKDSMKIMLVTFVPIILIFSFLKGVYHDAQIGYLFRYGGLKLPILGEGFGWVEAYIFSSILFSTILRKIFKVY